MTVAKAMKSPGQKTKTPKKGPITPNVKSPKVKGVGTPAGTPKQKGSNMDKTPKKPVTPANGTPKPKTPKMNGSNKPQTPNPKGNATPKLKTPKSEEPQANVTPNVISQKPNKSPKSLGKRSAEAAGLDNKAPSTVSKFLRIYNLPNMENEKLMGEVKKLLEPRGEIVKMKREKGCIVVEYAKGEDARAAKKLNGVVVGGRHLTFVHIEDRDLPTEHRITITQCPNNMTDEDVWSLFGSCGKILSIHFNRHWKTRIIQKCFVTFDNKKAVQQALSKPKTLGGKTLSVAEVTTDTRALHAAYPIENTVYLLGLPADVADTDVKKLVGKVCPVTAVTIVEATRRYAIVYITNESDVEKALKLNGTVLNGTKLKAERSRKSAHYKKSEDASVKKVKKEVPAKKQKLDKKAAQVKEESEEEDDDDEEEEDDDDDDDDDDSEDLLAAFQGKMQELKQKGTKDDDEEGDDDDDDDEEEDEEDDDEDDDDEDGDEDDEDEEGDEDDEEADDDDDDDDDDE